jgi:hypothetical protein
MATWKVVHLDLNKAALLVGMLDTLLVGLKETLSVERKDLMWVML